MDILINIIISALAVAYTLELFDSLLPFDFRMLKLILNLPLSVLFCWLIGISGNTIFVAVPATGFLALSVIVAVTRMSTTKVDRRR
jgi:ABC-type multidrug transport system permease subunit